MINVKIVAVGNLKEQYLKDACGEYIKRLKRYCNISVKELNESKPVSYTHLTLPTIA